MNSRVSTSQAGGDVKIFGEEVKDLLHDFTGGLQRAINNLAIACLLHATSLHTARVDKEVPTSGGRIPIEIEAKPNVLPTRIWGVCATKFHFRTYFGVLSGRINDVMVSWSSSSVLAVANATPISIRRRTWSIASTARRT